MDPAFTVQVFSHPPLSLISLLQRLSRLVKTGEYSYAAVYQTIDGPYLLGQQAFKSVREDMSTLTFLSFSPASDTREMISQMAWQRKRNYVETIWEQNSKFLSSEKFTADRIWAPQSPALMDKLLPMDMATGDKGIHSPCK